MVAVGAALSSGPPAPICAVFPHVVPTFGLATGEKADLVLDAS